MRRELREFSASELRRLVEEEVGKPRPLEQMELEIESLKARVGQEEMSRKLA